MRSGPADICLLLEGTYPFVRGGVSSWVHQIISGLPELKFSIAFIGSRRSDYEKPHYVFPDNVVGFFEHYIEDSFKRATSTRSRMLGKTFSPVRLLHEALRKQTSDTDGSAPRTQKSAMGSVLPEFIKNSGFKMEHFLFGDKSWRYFQERYYEEFSGLPFLDYFWTLRIMHVPVFGLAQYSGTVPKARVYHAVSTGYAGILGAFLRARRQRPLILTEHGIYTKERKIDLYQTEWLDTHFNPFSDAHRSPGLRELWIRFFKGLGRMTYAASEPIISLYAGNQERQIADGAPKQRTRVIVNGIDIARFAACRTKRKERIPPVVGLIGRIVPIKDVKTFIRTMGYIIGRMPDAEGWIIGDSDESPDYADQCRALARHLGISQQVSFLGFRDVTDIFPQLGLLMLSSISEAQPLAVLEAFAAGVPVVATDVGGCREQIEGRTAEDRASGLAGRVAPIANPEELGKAAVALLSNPSVWESCSKAGIERVERYYTQSTMLNHYRNVYAEASKP